MDTINIYGYMIPAWLIIPVVFFLWLLGMYYFKRVLFDSVRKLTTKTKTNIDDIIIKSADLPINLLILASGGVIVEHMLPITFETKTTVYFILGFKIATIVAIVLFIDRVINALMKEYSTSVDILKSSGGVLRGIIRAVVIGLGVLILMDSLGISITPIIASLGISSLAIALALQPTLENLFAGIQLVIDKPISVGHFIKLDSGEEGYVHKIGWRSTWVRMLPNNMVVMPNKSLVNARITNYYYPDKQLAVLIQVGVHYESDLEKVEKVTIEVAKETLNEVKGGVKEFEPFIRYHTFADFSINFTVILRAHEFVDNYLIKHEFVKRLHRRYAKEGISIPYPIRAINYDQEKAYSKD